MIPNWDLWLAAIRRYKWPLALLFYALYIKVDPFSGLTMLGLFMGLGAAALEADRRRESGRFDSFSGGSLFFRYGEEILDTAFTFTVKSGLEPAEVSALADTLQSQLSSRIRSSLFGQRASVDEALKVQNSRTGQEKQFIRVVAFTGDETKLSYFAHYQAFGTSVTAHYSSRIRGRTSDLALVKFITMCPFSIWLWGVPWLLNRYSIMAEVSGSYGDSFDAIDIATIFRSIHYDVMGKTTEILEENGLLSDELREQLVNITQNITASGSSTITVGSVNQSVPRPLPKLRTI